APLELTAYVVRGEPITFGDAARGDYRAFHVGDKWGPPWSTTWFRVRGDVPRDWAGKNVVAYFDLGFKGHPGFTCEALAWRDGWRSITRCCTSWRWPSRMRRGVRRCSTP